MHERRNSWERDDKYTNFSSLLLTRCRILIDVVRIPILSLSCPVSDSRCVCVHNCSNQLMYHQQSYVARILILYLLEVKGQPCTLYKYPSKCIDSSCSDGDVEPCFNFFSRNSRARNVFVVAQIRRTKKTLGSCTRNDWTMRFGCLWSTSSVVRLSAPRWSTVRRVITADYTARISWLPISWRKVTNWAKHAIDTSTCTFCFLPRVTTRKRAL